MPSRGTMESQGNGDAQARMRQKVPASSPQVSKVKSSRDGAVKEAMVQA